MAKYKIELDKEKCIGCGVCENTCPENFELTDDGKARVKEAEVTEISCNKEAEEICPVDAIKITEVK
jgi:ferredoxin